MDLLCSLTIRPSWMRKTHFNSAVTFCLHSLHNCATATRIKCVLDGMLYRLSSVLIMATNPGLLTVLSSIMPLARNLVTDQVISMWSSSFLGD